MVVGEMTRDGERWKKKKEEKEEEEEGITLLFVKAPIRLRGN